MSLGLRPDASEPDRGTPSQALTPDGPSPAETLDPGTQALRDLTRGAVQAIYGAENANLAEARLEEVAQFDRDRAVEIVATSPGALAPVEGDRSVAAQLAAALPVRFASQDVATPPVTAETIERDGVTYRVEGLTRVRDERGATHLVGASNEPAVAYLDRERGFPYTFHVRAFHPDAQFGGYFSGDNRTFSTSLDVTSRVEQTLMLDTSTDRISSSDRSDLSHHPILGTDRANPDGGVPDYRLSNDSEAVETHTFGTWVQGANPLTPAFATPNIDVDGRFTVTEDLARGRLRIQAACTGDNFPNTEAFVTDRAGTPVFIATGTLAGNPLTALPGDNETRAIMNADLEIHVNRDGAFTGVTSGGRVYTIAEWNRRVGQNPQ